ncbi:MAG: 50S ribosomal protein L3 [Parcubacteria group bacterium GW2011_GWA2_43_9b]|uniref:Large ribosomal subunit protein uL3 n=1 Tax=Candidatus Portnoybacteria bacterium RIFCSPLOWO2_02_FULL_39_11 TaxID=1802001 RepID=A0A1G2FVY7_9BACT|nr:MAG: 50S ribosomal protein L3 [Parcubacteria group bacterium GW2011_GWA2_43_9b]OGZ42234.1 MAG: 50S ribosomal protein L3 [Candidatus Portnoybacteria bacterium RIFCSPLOWO2_02_FULL_39_11]
MKFILGKKIEMSQVFDKDGLVIPVTLVQAGPCFVTQKKTADKDGYNAVQIGFGEMKEKKVNKAKKGHLKKCQMTNDKCQNLKFLREYRVANSELELGSEIKADIFQEGDLVKVAGISKGKGFAGVVKRHHFGGGPATHGQKHSLRAPGSIGATFPERVPKGRRMGGRMGGERSTVRGLKIVKVDAANNILAILGAVPGIRGGLLEIVSE